MKKPSKERVELFAIPTDPNEMKQAVDRIARGGRTVVVVTGPSHDTGLGPCGKKLCHCQLLCAMHGRPIAGAYTGDKGPTMGAGY